MFNQVKLVSLVLFCVSTDYTENEVSKDGSEEYKDEGDDIVLGGHNNDDDDEEYDVTKWTQHGDDDNDRGQTSNAVNNFLVTLYWKHVFMLMKCIISLTHSSHNPKHGSLGVTVETSVITSHLRSVSSATCTSVVMLHPTHSVML